MNLSRNRRVVLTLATGGLLTLVMILLALQSIRAAGPWYVAPGGDDGNDCLSPGAPCATINGALGKAGPGDTIFVAVGTYTGTGDQVVLLDKDATLSGGWDGTFTDQIGTSSIDGEQSRGGIIVNSGVTAIVDWINAQNGSVGISNDGALTLSNSTISGNADHGIHNNGSLTMSNSTVRGNTAYLGGGIYNMATLTLNKSTVSGNTAGYKGGGIYNSTGFANLNNSTVTGNMASSEGGGIYKEYGTLSLNSSTITGNEADDGGGIAYYAVTVVMQNTILAGNTGGNAPDCRGHWDTTIESSGYNLVGDTSGCDFSAGIGDLTNISPKLGLLMGSPAYHPLSDSSPAIDAGNPAGCTDHQGDPLDTDQRGAARVGTCDIGSYEYTPPGPADSIFVVSGTPQRTPPFFTFDLPFQALVLDAIGTPVHDATVTFSAPATGASGTFADSGTRTTTVQADEYGIATAAAFTANGERGSYTVAATVGGVPSPANYLLRNIGWYVSEVGSDANDCQIPTTPCATITGPLSKADFVAGDAVLVASGWYTGQGDEVVRLEKGVRLLGGWDSAFTVQSGVSTIDGQATRSGLVVNEGVTAFVERVAVQNGLGGIENEGRLTLKNSTVSGNSAWRGGGIANGYNGILAIWNCSITVNVAEDRGGGINNNGVADLNNSTISGNIGGAGGGIASGGYLTLSSCTVTRNMAEGTGGIYWHGGTVTLQNSILAENALPTGTDCYGRITSLGYTLVGNATDCDLTSGEGDLIGVSPSLGPLLGSPGYHPLQPDSLAIDAGNPAGCTDHLGNLLPVDQRGAPRSLDGNGDGGVRCDIGAYEFDPEHPVVHVFLPLVGREY